jgi:hypothetical protein
LWTAQRNGRWPAAYPLSPGPFGFYIEGQRQAGAHHADHRDNLHFLVPNRSAPLAALLAGATAAGAVKGQADKGTPLKGLVALGAAEDVGGGGARGVGVQPLGEVSQGVFAEGGGHPQSAASGRAHRGLAALEAPLAQDLAEQ